MIDSNNQLPYLAARVGKGDPRAVLELKHELEAQMPRIVRRAKGSLVVRPARPQCRA